jgi:hypothetical protein
MFCTILVICLPVYSPQRASARIVLYSIRELREIKDHYSHTFIAPLPPSHLPHLQHYLADTMPSFGKLPKIDNHLLCLLHSDYGKACCLECMMTMMMPIHSHIAQALILTAYLEFLCKMDVCRFHWQHNTYQEKYRYLETWNPRLPGNNLIFPYNPLPSVMTWNQ